MQRRLVRLLPILLATFPAPATAFLTATPTTRQPPPSRDRPAPPPDLPRRLAVPTSSREVVSLVETRLRVTIRHGIAVCRLVQVFQNNTHGVLEGTYRLPLAADAEVHGFTVWDEGTRLVGELRPRAQARSIYRAERERLEEAIRARRALRDPGLLERDGGRACQIRVFPILPRGLKRIEVAYSQPLGRVGGRTQFTFPLDLTCGFEHVGRTRVEIDLDDDLGVERLSAGPGVAPVRDGRPGRRLVARHRGRIETPLTLAWSARAGTDDVTAVAHRPPGEDGFVMLRLRPDDARLAAALKAAPVDWLIVVDLSGAVVRDKRAAADRMTGALLGALAAGDRFRLIAVTDRPRDLSRGWRPASGRAGALAALRTLRAAGCPRLGPVLAASLRALDPRRASRVVVLTDGLLREDPEDLARVVRSRLPERATLDAVGLGFDDDDETLAALAAAGRGQRTGPRVEQVMASRELGGGAAPWDRRRRSRQRRYGATLLRSGSLLGSRFLRRDRAPLRDLRVVLGDGPVRLRDVHADWQAGLFPGQAARVYARYRGHGRVRLTVHGTLGGRPWSRPIEVTLPQAEPANRVVGAFWARRQVQALERRGPIDDDVRRQIVALSLRHRFATSQTAFLALTDAMRRRHGLGGAPVDDVDQILALSPGQTPASSPPSDPTAAPEPGTLTLLLLAAAGAALQRRRREEDA